MHSIFTLCGMTLDQFIMRAKLAIKSRGQNKFPSKIQGLNGENKVVIMAILIAGVHCELWNTTVKKGSYDFSRTVSF